jgi:DNA processing protein
VDLPTLTALSLLAGTGESPRRSRLALAVRDTDRSGPEELLLRLARLWNEDPAALARQLAETRDAAEAAIARGARSGLTPIVWREAPYPSRLAAIYDPPPVLWYRGDVSVLARPSIALVGARAASTYALDVAERLGEGLARRGFSVVSGLARGVDGAAHRGALGGGGPTVAVLGSGADVIYPAEHRDLSEAVVRSGAILSEHPPGSGPRPEHFPLRNRIISGLSIAVVVIEASEKSGSLITARSALEQGREVMAVPGNVLSARNRGSHALLKDGAKLVEGVDDILEGLGPAIAFGFGEAGSPNGSAETANPLIEEPLLSHMEDGEGYALEDLEALTGMPAPALLARLLELEMAGQVVRREAGRFMRLAKGC